MPTAQANNTLISKALLSSHKGLTCFDIKIIALVLMLLDHIHYFFEFTGAIPLLFTQLGRLSAPLFLFCLVEGFCHTSNKKRYFFRIYIISVLMGFVQYCMMRFHILVRQDEFIPICGIFASLIIVLTLLQGIYLVENGRKLLGLLLFSATFILPYIINLFCYLAALPSIFSEVRFFITQTFLPMHNSVSDGGTWFILGGVLLYLLRKSKYLQACAYALYALISEVLLSWFYYGPFPFSHLFTEQFQWMMAFSAIIMIMYNQKRGKQMKNLFYIFYPSHIYILYLASIILYAMFY